MRRILSSITLCSIFLSIAGPTFGQISVKRGPAKSDLVDGSDVFGINGRIIPGLSKAQPKKLPKKTTFAKVEAYSDGKGAWVRWKMETEIKNSGFRVLRTGRKGETPVSGFIMGSSFVTGDDPLNGAEYNFFDPKGSQENAYVIEALTDSGKVLRSGHFVPEYVPSIDEMPDGGRVKAESLAPKAGDNRVAEQLNVSSELATEIQRGLNQPDPARHREVISTPGGVRIASKADGLIRVLRTELQNGGFDVNTDPGNWQIYMDGVELPMIVGPNADYIEFLGKSINNLYSDQRVYYLIPGATPGRRIAEQFVRPPLTSVRSRKYDQTFVREDKKNYTGQILNGDAENWWGDVVSAFALDYKFNLSGIDRTAGTRKMTVNFQGYSLAAHSVEMTLNGTLLPNATGNLRFTFEKVVDVPVSLLLDGENTLRLRSTLANDTSLLSKLSIEFPRDFVAVGNKLEFYTDNFKNANVSGFTSSNVRVFDVTYENTPQLLTGLEMAQTNGTWGPVIPAGRGRVIYAVEAGVFGSAFSVTPNDPALLADPSNAGTMLIISHPDLMTQANAWGTYRSGLGTVTKVIDVRDIYDEFNYGVISSQAIEDFLLYAKNNWQTPPSYVLLIGDGHYDPKNYDGLDPGYWNMIPARLVDTLFEQTGSDESLSDFNNDGLAEIPIGRIAARSGDSVTAALNKTQTWESSLTPASLDLGVVFAYDRPNGYNFKAMSDRVQAVLPVGVPKLNIAEANCTVETDINTCTTNTNGNLEIRNAVNTPGGKYILNYTGHGALAFWSRETFFDVDHVPDLTNASHPLLVTSLTCLNGYFMADQPSNISFAEAMLISNTGGSVGVWASTGKTTPDVQEIMAKRFYLKIGEGNIQRIGDLINDAKAQVPAGVDVRLSWALLGDPMLKVR